MNESIAATLRPKSNCSSLIHREMEPKIRDCQLKKKKICSYCYPLGKGVEGVKKEDRLGWIGGTRNGNGLAGLRSCHLWLRLLWVFGVEGGKV